MPKHGITETNIEVERLLDKTQNPRHRYLLIAFARHRYLEIAGRYAEFLGPDMTVEHPVYRFNIIGLPSFKLDGQEAIAAMYRSWAETNQSIFYGEDETLAVGDNMVVSRSILYQQQLGSALRDERGIDADPDAVYLMKANIAMIWPYDDRGRMIGEDVWEYDDADHDLIKLEPADVVTTEQAATLLDPLIKPLPPFPTE